MALPNSNITTTMVGKELGLSTRNVGNLCRSTAINKWSKWKPVRFNKLTGLIENDLKSVNFGLTTEEVSPSQLPSTKALENGMFIGGTYLQPRGGTQNEFYRLGDFRNYEKNSIPPIESIILQNWSGGDKPIAGNPSYPDVSPLYFCRLKFNLNSNIKLSEMKTTSLNLSNLYLTLVIGANISGMSVSESIVSQSTNSVQEAISSGHSEMLVEMDTTNLVNVLGGISANIAFVYLAPKITGTLSQFPNGVSLKIDQGYQSTKYNPSYAIYGDGGEGGVPPVTTVNGTWNWLSNNPTVYSDGTIMFDLLIVNIDNGAAGFGGLHMYVNELNTEYLVTPTRDSISFSMSTTQTIDTSVVIHNLGNLVDPVTGNPLTQINCTFYVLSNTPGASPNFNVQTVVLPVQ